MEKLKMHFQTYFNLEDKQLDTLVSCFTKEEIKKGGIFIKQGYTCNKFAFIENGIFRVSTIVDDSDITQWIATSGYYVTDLVNFIQDEKSRWTITALTDCTIYSILKSDYNRIEGLINNWNKIERTFIIHCFTLLENRILQSLSMTAEERYLSFFENNKNLFNQIPQHYIASMLGMSPETLSRIRRRS